MGSQRQTTIEINGKHYDARTGKLLTGSTGAHPIKKHPQTKHAPRTMNDIARPRPSKPVHKSVERSKTLMRSAVRKPAPATHTAKPHTVSDFRPIKSSPVKKQPLALATHNDAERAKRAQHIKQSKLVSKFSDHKTSQKPLDPMKSEIQQRAETMPVRQALKQHTAPNSVNTVLERGLKNAQSHTQTLKSKRGKARGRHTKLLSYGAGALAALMLVGFIGYQNIPNISMRYAAARAGITASLPGYQPAGFALDNHIQYNPGHITVKFSSNTDEREFTITQKETTWNSDALLSNYVTTKTENVQKYEDKGRTIFLYDDNSATWVNGGVWFDIKGDSLLNSDQLIRIATSM